MKVERTFVYGCRVSVVALLGLTILGFTGCESAQNMFNQVDKPGFNVIGANVSDLSLQDVQLLFDVNVNNPYDVPLPLSDVHYRLSSGGKQIATGRAPLSGYVPAQGNKTVQVPVDLVFDDLAKAVRGVKPGSVVPYNASLMFTADPTGYTPLKQEVSRAGELPVPAVPEVALQSMRLKNLSLANVQAEVAMNMTNTNAFKVSLDQLGYSLALSGVKVAEAKLNEGISMEPGDTAELKFPLQFSPMALGTTVYRVLTGDSANYSISGQMKTQTPFGPIDMPYSRSGQVPLMK